LDNVAEKFVKASGGTLKNYLSRQEWLRLIRDHAFRLKNALPIARFPLSSPQHPTKCFFIVGSGRSGNTLVRSVLTASPVIHIPPETYVLGEQVESFRRVSGLGWNDVIHLVFAKLAFHPEFKTFEAPYLNGLIGELRALPASERNLASALDRFYRWHARQNNKDEVAIWGDKTPINVYSLKKINGIFPSAKYVYLTRAPHDVVHSYVKSGIYNNYRDAAIRWQESNLLCMRMEERMPSSVLRVSYEEFCREPEGSTREICGFLGTPFVDSMIAASTRRGSLGDVYAHAHHERVLTAIDQKSIGRGRTDMPADAARLVDSICGATAAALGYEVR
jgi:hypothetical protein